MDCHCPYLILSADKRGFMAGSTGKLPEVLFSHLPKKKRKVSSFEYREIRLTFYMFYFRLPGSLQYSEQWPPFLGERLIKLNTRWSNRLKSDGPFWLETIFCLCFKSLGAILCSRWHVFVCSQKNLTWWNEHTPHILLLNYIIQQTVV